MICAVLDTNDLASALLSKSAKSTIYKVFDSDMGNAIKDIKKLK